MSRCRIFVCFLACVVVNAVSAQALPSTTSSALTVAPSPLLAVDQNRASIVEGIVANWKGSLQTAFAEASPEKEAELRATLNALRADRLLSASLAGTLDGLARALATSEASVPLAQTAGGSLLKALGDATRDLVYTPINPCRIVDTRSGGGGLIAAGTDRNWNASRPGGNFADQGGEGTDCAIPAAPAALLANLAVTGNSAPGVLFASAFNQPPPTASTLNWAAGQTIANAVIVPLAVGQAKELTIFASAGTHVVIDVLGFFKAPAGVTGDITGVSAGTGLSGGAVSGEATLAITPSYRLPQGCGNGQVAKSDGAGGWSCQNDLSGGGGGTGTVTSITAGTGLSGGTITVSGTIGIANGGVGATQLAGGSVDVSKLNTASTDARYFRTGGNAFGATALFGTIDNRALDIVVNGARAMRYDPKLLSPNIIGGHPNNLVGLGHGVTISGGGYTGNGCYEPISQDFTRYCGNTADADYVTVGGGMGNSARNTGATVGGGRSNTAEGATATIGGGYANTASGDNSTVGGGVWNVASGIASTVIGGISNEAVGNYSVAVGFRAKANHNGAFVFADSRSFDFASGSDDSFRVRATGGGVRFVVSINGDGTMGTNCLLNSINAGWSCASDRALKKDLRRLDGKAVLAKLAALPVFEWTPKAATTPVRHFGPTAQDFHAAFGLGDSELLIGSQDADGVALAAIQGLHQFVQEKDREIARMERELRELKTVVKALAAKSR